MSDKQALRSEIIACGRNPLYFINRYVKIKHPTRGLIPFETFDYQDQLIQDYLEHRFNVILKARQLGISEITAAYATWLMLFHRDKNILVMASKADTAKNIIKKVGTALKKLPSWLCLADITTDNKLSIELSNGSQIKAIATSEDAGRSEALSLLIIDEAAFVPRFDELWTGLLPTVTAGGNVIVLSTPNGVGNKFHQLYIDAEEGSSEFHSNKFMWWVHPERISDLEDDPTRPGFKTSSWFRNEVKSTNMSPRDVAQELECNFNSSGDTLISGEQLLALSAGALFPMKMEHVDRNLHIWWDPQKDKRYLLTADVARGDGRDNSAFHIFDLSVMEQVAEYYGKVPVEEFAKLIVETGRRYNNCIVAVENTTIGLACLEHVRLLGYEAVYYSRKGDTRGGEIVNAQWGTAADDLVAGFTMSPKSRPLVISKLEEYIRTFGIVIRSKRFVEELKTFIWVNGRPEAMRGYNDDLVMSAAIAVWLRDTFLAPYSMSTEVQKQLVSGMSQRVTVNTDIDGASKDPKYVSQKAMGTFVKSRNPYEIRTRHGARADFSWLLKN
jgi:hypothetical protein